MTPLQAIGLGVLGGLIPLALLGLGVSLGWLWNRATDTHPSLCGSCGRGIHWWNHNPRGFQHRTCARRALRDVKRQTRTSQQAHPTPGRGPA